MNGHLRRGATCSRDVDLCDLLQVAGDLGADGDSLEWRHRAEGVDGQRHVADRYRRHAHGLRRLSVAARIFAFLVRGLAMLEFLPREDGRHGQRGDDRDPHQKAAPARSRRFDGRRGRALRDVVRFEGLVHP